MADGNKSKDDVVRQLARLNMTTRQIAAQTGVSQSTVVRTLKRINTGPMPVFKDDMTDDSPTDPMLPVTVFPGERRGGGSGPGFTAALILVATAIVLVGAAALLAWRVHQTPAQQPSQPVMACVHYKHGYVNGVQGDSVSGCPGGWKLVQLPG